MVDRQRYLLYQRAIDQEEFLPLWFATSALERYRQQEGYRLLRTNTVRIRSAACTLLPAGRSISASLRMTGRSTFPSATWRPGERTGPLARPSGHPTPQSCLPADAAQPWRLHRR
jgi:hypothetical protein